MLGEGFGPMLERLMNCLAHLPAPPVLLLAHLVALRIDLLQYLWLSQGYLATQHSLPRGAI